MTHEDKKGLVEAAKAYMKEERVTQNQFSKLTGVNTSYMSSILKGVFTYTNSKNGDKLDIDEKWFTAIAETIGYTFPKEYWPLVLTEQFIDILKELTEAKNTAATRIIIGETGCGKSFTVDRFIKANPEGTFKVICSDNDNLSDLVRKIQKSLGTNFEGSNNYKIEQISIELDSMTDKGIKPQIIFDESECLKKPGFSAIKSIYDYLKGICSIVLIGTSDLLNKLERFRNKEGWPQIIRRFKAGIRIIHSIDRSYKRFFEGKELSKGLKLLLQRNADNYGELADYLEPMIREADHRGIPLTEEFFNTMCHLNK